MRLHAVLITAFILVVFNCSAAGAAVGTNPASGNPLDYSGAGDWTGSGDPDQLTNETGATVTGRVYGNNNTVASGTSGGENTVTNAGTVTGYVYGSYNEADGVSGGSNTVINSGSAGSRVYGSYNQGINSSGGSNTVINSGTMANYLYGSRNTSSGTSGGGNTVINSGTTQRIYSSYNNGDYSSGGSNNVVNSGTVNGFILGTYNIGKYSTGGSNTIINSGTALTHLYGSYNADTGASGGGNTIDNSGAVGGNIYGSRNDDNDTSGGGNTITNSGTVTGDIYGNYNLGASSTGGGNTIDNSGTVGGDIYGTCNLGAGASSGGAGNTITNGGTVGGGIYAGDADDTVHILSGSSVGGVVDGQTGTDSLYYGASGVMDSATFSIKYINFENLGLYVDGDTTLTGNWVFNLGSTVTATGTFTLNSTLGSTSLDNAGKVTFNGDASFSGAVTNSGSLAVESGGSLSADSLTNSGGMAIAGSVDVGTLNNDGGGLGVAGSLTADNLINSGGIGIGGTVTVGSLVNSGAIGVGGTLTAGSVTNSGNLAVGGTMSAGSVSNSGTLDVNGSVSTGSLTNSGGLDVTVGGSLVAGSLNNSGTASITGTAYVTSSTTNSGSLNVNGTLLTASLLNSGTISGSGTIHSNTINTGTISPGNSIGTLTISGTYTHGSGSTFQCEVAADGSSDLLRAGRTIIQGGAVRLVMPVGYYAGGETWTIFSADQGINGQFDNVYADSLVNSAVLGLSMEYSGTEAKVMLSRESYGDFGANTNQRTVGRALDVIRPLAEGDMEQFLLAMDYEFSAAEIGRLLAACNPEMYDGMTWAALDNTRQFDGIMQDRADWGRAAAKLGTDLGSKGGPVNLAAEETGRAVAAEPLQKDWSMWARALGNWQRRGGDVSNLGYAASSGGAVLGADGPVSPWLRLGLAFAAGQTDLDYSSAGDGGTQKSMQGGLYATADLGDFYLDAGLSYSTFDNDTERGVAFDGVAATAKASYDSSAWLARLGGGWDFRQDHWIMGPRLDVGYLSLSEDSLRESGADFLNLDVQDRDADYWSTALGLRAAARYELAGWSLLPRVELAWRHGFDGDARAIEASFRDYAGQGFTVYGQEPVQDELRMQAGLRAVLGEGFNAFVQLGLAWADNYSGQDLSLGLNYAF